MANKQFKRSNGIIVGTGHAGAQVAIALRQNGFAGQVTMISRESEPPYERPPLSKEYMAGEKEFERIYIRPPAFWQEKQIELLLGRSVEHVNAANKTITLNDGSVRTYDTLVWAGGGDPRRLPIAGGNLGGVHCVRNRADVDTIMVELSYVAQVAVIGGGYIGLEAAAVLNKLGKKVVLLEALPRVLARVAGPELSAFYEAEHKAHGVDLRTNVKIDSLQGTDGKVSGVRLEDGSVIEAQLVIVGIGIIPSVSPLLAAGATGGNGVEVDGYCRTSLPDVYAIGDCAAHRNTFAGGELIRLESVQNAHDQAVVAAKAICGASAQPYIATPWFWSNQYDLKLQTVGLSIGYDEMVLRGDPATRSFSLIYLKDGKVVALDCVNMIKDYVQGRKLVEAGASVSTERLSDTSVALKDLLTT